MVTDDGNGNVITADLVVGIERAEMVTKISLLCFGCLVVWKLEW